MRSVILFVLCLFVLLFSYNINCSLVDETIDIYAGAKLLPQLPREYSTIAAAQAELDSIEETPSNNVLSPRLLVKILRLLPSGPEYNELYVTIGGKLGEITFNSMSQAQRHQLRMFLRISSGLEFGQKIGTCFAYRGFLVQEKNNLLTGILIPIASNKATEITQQKVEEMIRSNKIESKYGHVFAGMIRDFSSQLAPYIASKLLQCLLGPNVSQVNLPANIKLSDVLGVLPTGEKYNRAYQLLGHVIGEEGSAELMKGKMLASKATSIGGWIGQSVGKCVALYGWKIEDKSNMMINLFMRILRSKRATALLSGQLDRIISKYQLSRFGPDTVKLIQTIGMSLGDYAGERFLQCLLLPISQRERDYKLIPIAQLKQSELRRSSSEAELDSFGPKYLMHNRDLHQLQKHIAINIAVNV